MLAFYFRNDLYPLLISPIVFYLELTLLELPLGNCVCVFVCVYFNESCFGVVYKITLPNIKLQKFSVSSRRLIVLGITLKSVVYFEFIFKYDASYESSSFFICI